MTLSSTKAGPSPHRPVTEPSPIDAISALIGGTPLVEIRYRFDGRSRRLYAKYEIENMTGSIKDRMAAYILRRGYADGDLRPGMTIVEASSGNTGISFAALGSALSHPVRIYIPDWMSRERIELIRSFGAEVVLVSAEEGGFIGAVTRAESDAATHDDVFVPRQFDNRANIEAHEQSTGPEIERQLAAFNRRVDAFVAGVGTGGTVMGVGRYLRRVAPAARIHPLEPANSPTLRTGHRVGHHRIQGISDEFIPSIVDLDELDETLDAWDGDAILMAQYLCRQLGLAVGISSGANFLGAVQLVEELGPEATVVTIFPDSNKKYLSTALCHDEPVQPSYLRPRIELERIHAVR
ncbi:MAG: PLP-dependent cysteine synthase family protein [Phycisphaerales bacterium]|nr:PLP-dependent cysteine synthase family protein [Phycisphaerales bacterium]NNM25045.1 PLP-dependent cysteine synthase family protein [Phycisphaerales bacterium]